MEPRIMSVEICVLLTKLIIELDGDVGGGGEF